MGADMTKWIPVIELVCSIILIGVGAFMVYPPSCPIAIGLLLFVDAEIGIKE